MEPAPIAPEPRAWPHFDPPNVLWYFGAITAAFFSIAQLSEVTDSERGLWILLSALAWIALYLVLGSLLRRRGWWIAGGLALAVAVSLVSIVVFAFERLVGVWPEHARGTGPNGALFALALVTACAGLVAFAVVRFPFILFATAAAVVVSTQTASSPALSPQTPARGPRSGPEALSSSPDSWSIAPACARKRSGRTSSASSASRPDSSSSQSYEATKAGGSRCSSSARSCSLRRLCWDGRPGRPTACSASTPAWSTFSTRR